MKRFVAIIMTLCMVLGMSSIGAWAAEEMTWQAEPEMPIVYGYVSSCSIGDKIYVLGTKRNPHEIQIAIYNTKTGTWETKTSAPSFKQHIACTAVGEKIYLFSHNNDRILNLQIYNTKTNIWESSEEIPKIKIEMGHSAVTVGEKVYLISYNEESKVTKLYILNTATGVWTTGSDMPNHINYTGTVAVGNNIYVIGGNTCGAAGTFNSVYIYNLETDTWSKGADMAYARSGLAASVYGNNVYAIGGSRTYHVEVYDIITNSWKTISRLREVRSLFSSTVVNGRLYVMGGQGDGESKCTMESLQVGTQTTTPKLSVLLNTGETVQLSTSYNLADNANYTWSSTNEAVATVDANGKVTAVAVGEADIYAQNADGTFKEYIPVKVVEGIADELRLAVHLKAGEKAKLYLTDNPSEVTWRSMDESVATVSSDGQVTGIKKGLAIIQGELAGGTYQIYVRVNG